MYNVLWGEIEGVIKAVLEKLASDVVSLMWEPTVEDSRDGVGGGADEPLKFNLTNKNKNAKSSSLSLKTANQLVEGEVEKSPTTKEDKDVVTHVEWIF